MIVKVHLHYLRNIFRTYHPIILFCMFIAYHYLMFLFIRSFLGPGVPAQWPSCSRLVEAVIIRLCGKLLSPRKKDGKYQPRFDAVLEVYSRIRTAILEQPTLIGSGIILPELNQHTIRTW